MSARRVYPRRRGQLTWDSVLEKPNGRREMTCEQLREHYLAALNAPIPPRLKALVEEFRQLEGKKPRNQ